MTEGVTGADATPPRRDERPWSSPGPDAAWWRGPAAESEPSAADAEPAAAKPPSPAPPADASKQPLADPVAQALADPAEPSPADSAKERLADPPEQPPADLPETVVLAGHRPFDTPPRVTAPRMAVQPSDDPTAIRITAPVATPVPPPAPIDARRETVILPARTSDLRPPRHPQPVRRRKPPRRPWVALPALVVLASAAVFFAWVSVEPFWLAVGHGKAGTATVVAAPADRCQADFVAEGDAFTSRVDLAGLPASACRVGVAVPARMVSPTSPRAYSVDDAGLNLRWGVGFGLVLLCGLAIVWVTGASRLPGWRRIVSTALSFAGPVGFALAFLIVTY